MKTNEGGFSLVETMIAATVMIVVVGGGLNVVVMSQTALTEGTTRIVLQRGASDAVERIVKGAQGAGELRLNGIREADSVVFPNASTVNFTSPFDTITRSFYLNGNDLMYDPDITMADDEEVMYDLDAGGVPADYTSQLTFTQLNARLVQVQLAVRQRVRDKWIRAAYETNVYVRNQS